MKINLTAILILIFLIGLLVGGLGSRELFPKFEIKEKIVRPDFSHRDTVTKLMHDTIRITEKAIVVDTLIQKEIDFKDRLVFIHDTLRERVIDTLFTNTVAQVSKTYSHGTYDITYSYLDQEFGLTIQTLDTNFLFREIQYSETPEEKRKKWYERTLIFLGGIGVGALTIVVAT